MKLMISKTKLVAQFNVDIIFFFQQFKTIKKNQQNVNNFIFRLFSFVLFQFSINDKADQMLSPKSVCANDTWTHFNFFPIKGGYFRYIKYKTSIPSLTLSNSFKFCVLTVSVHDVTLTVPILNNDRINKVASLLDAPLQNHKHC